MTKCNVQCESQGNSVQIEVCSKNFSVETVSNLMHCDQQHEDQGFSVIYQVTPIVEIQSSCIPLDLFQANLP